jgi:hypothetical protein
MSAEPGSPQPAWSIAFFSLLHPVQIAAVEAFEWTGEPMSALMVYEVLGREWPFGTVAYHVRRLAESGVLARRWVEPVRGAHEHFFLLAR